MQSFTKQKPEAYIEYHSGSAVYMGSANLYTAIEAQKTAWKESMKVLAEDDKSIVKFDRSEKMYVVDKEAIASMPIKNDIDKLEFLKAIGINITPDVYEKIKNKNKFATAVGAIYAYLGRDGKLYSLRKESLDINGPLSELANLYVAVTNPNFDSTYTGVNGQQINSYADNNAPSLFENQFNEAATIDELKNERKELSDIFSANSLILKKGGSFYDKDGVKKKDLKVSYIQGRKDVDDNKGFGSNKIGLAYRFTQEINQNVNGNYYVLMPGDGSTSWMMNLGNHISFENVDAGRAWNQLYTIFRGYLTDDIALALDWKNRSNLKNVKSKAKELRFFKELLEPNLVEKIHELIEKESTTQADVEALVDKNIESVNESIKKYIEETAEETRKILTEGNQITKYGEDRFAYEGLLDDFVGKEGLNKHNLSDRAVNNILLFANMNYVINNIEYHKILFGDPYQFAIVDSENKFDETKRIKSFLSPRRTTFDSNEFNNFLNNSYNKAGDISLNEKEFGYHNHKSYAKTVTLKDVKVAGSLSNIIAAYGKTNEADGASWIMDNTYREVKLKNSQWGEDAEEFHQWQMAYTRQNLPGYKYQNEELAKQDKELISKPAPKYRLDVLKPIVSGIEHNSTYMKLVLDKFSQMPIYYSMVKGTNLENIYLQMHANQIGYAVVESGRKLGVEDTHSIYNSDGSINKNSFSEKSIVNVSWKSYGIQVENSYEETYGQTRGSQITKMVSMDLYKDGQALSQDVEREFKRNTEALIALNQNRYERLLNKLGIVDTGAGFEMKDGKAISEILMIEMMKRELSENAVDTIQLDENDQFIIPFEASPSYTKIRDIMYSMIDKAILSPKMNGNSYVQAPVTGLEKLGKNRGLALKTKDGWEKITKERFKSLSEEEKKKVVITDDTLKFYTEGQLYMEVMLPNFIKEKYRKKFKTDDELLNYLNTSPDGKKLLKAIGFRIPTQSISSGEIIKIKGFLPDYMGKTVIVPSEITTKAGSDFDIDKLNIYLKNLYIDENGDIRLVQYKRNAEATKKFYGDLFDKMISERITRKEKAILQKMEDLDKIDMILMSEDESVEQDVMRRNKKLDDLIREFDDVFEDAAEFIENNLETLRADIQKLTNKELQSMLKDFYVNKMYEGALENEYYDSMEKLLTLQGFKRLITPVDDAGLGKVANDLNELSNNNTNPKNKIINRNYMTVKRHNFLMGKEWIGIIATNITSHAQMQKAKTYIDPQRFAKVPKQDREFLGNGKVLLPHNKVKVNGEDMISLSGTKTADGKDVYISDRLSGYATGSVDVVKDDRLVDIIKSTTNLSVSVFLERIGSGEFVPYFINQPIVVKYLSLLDSLGTSNLYNRANLDVIMQMFPTTDASLLSIEPDLSIDNMRKNIEEYAKNPLGSSAKNAEQITILMEYLKYAKMAQYSFKFTQAINYDTSSFRNSAALFKKLNRTRKAIDSNIIVGVEEVLSKTFVGEQMNLLKKFVQAMGDTVFVMDRDEFRVILENEILEQYADNEYLSQDNYDKIANKASAAFIDYIIATKTDIGKEVKRLLIDPETAVVNRLITARDKYPSIQILQEFEPSTSDRIGGAKSLKLKGNDRTPASDNTFIGLMRELRDTNIPELTELYKDIVKLSILQGVYVSNISFGNIIPLEDYAEIVAPIFRTIRVDDSIKAFAKGFFEANNFMDATIVPKVSPKFFLTSDEPVEFQFTDSGLPYADIYQYYSSLFINIKELGISGIDRKVLVLNEKYNGGDVRYKYIKIPRVVTDKKTGDSIDMKTGLTITKMDFAIRKEKGDMTLYDYYGYKKVMSEDGIPLVYVDGKGDVMHVYKLTNLYGDGPRAKENYQFLDPSVINNGTVKVVSEVSDQNIINYIQDKYGVYSDVLTPEEAALLQVQTPTAPEVEGEIKSEEVVLEEQKKELEEKGFSFYLTNSTYDVSHPQDGIIAEYVPTLQEAVKYAREYVPIEDTDDQEKIDEYIKSKLSDENATIEYAADIELIYDEETLRETLKDFITYQNDLEKANKLVSEGNYDEARKLMKKIPIPHKFDEDGNVEGEAADYETLLAKVIWNYHESIFERSPSKALKEAIVDIVKELTAIVSKVDEFRQRKNITEETTTSNVSFKEFGTEYKFTLVNNEPTEGLFKQGGKDWQPMNPKNIKSKYIDLVNKGIKSKQESAPEESGPKGLDIFQSRTNPIDYTEGQMKALGDVQNLVEKDKTNFYLLAGYAGTGKTTIAENIAKFAQANNRNILIMAPTNKAAKVLNDKLRAAGTSASASTIHKAIYGLPDPETGEWTVSKEIKNSVVIVDESSMISDELMKDLINTASKENNIVIFMGDSFQLEPVGKDSGLFQGKIPEVTGMTELTEVKRQSLDSNVLKFATLMRMENKPYIPSESVEDIKVAKSRQEFINDFKESVRNGEDSVMIVATNQERVIMNNIARAEKFGANKKVIEDGETIISVANSTDYPNSDILTANNVEVLGSYDISFNFNNEEVIYKTNLVSFVDANNVKQTLLLVPELFRPSLYHGQVFGAIRFGELKNKLNELGLIKRNKKGKESLSSDLVIGTYGYAITAHKSQGSQWQKVFVHQNYVGSSWNPARWFYTAVTRSAKDLVILPTSANVKIDLAQVNNKLEQAIPEEKPVSTFTESDKAIKTIGQFYASLTDQQKEKLGITSEQDLVNEYIEIPFDYSEEKFINDKKCLL
jgi:energy-coupling factor transporter ATP-binding protein EcfA2